MAAFPRLTELTLIYPHFHDVSVIKLRILFAAVRTARSTAVELVDACKVLPDFDTLQIVLYAPSSHRGVEVLSGSNSLTSVEQSKRVSEEQVDIVKDWAMECLKRAKPGCQGGDGRKKATLRVIMLSPYRPAARFYVNFAGVKVEEYEVWESGSDDP